MKIIAFAGSPRIQGNSDILLDECLRGAEHQGAEVEKIYLDNLTISPCRACDVCRSNGGQCVYEDDMQPIYQKLAEADIWVLATPIYWWGPTAQLKLMVDRWYSFYKYIALKQKKAALILTMGDTRMKVAVPTILMFDMAFEYLGIEQIEPLVVSAHAKGEVKDNTEAMNKAYQLGISMCQ